VEYAVRMEKKRFILMEEFLVLLADVCEYSDINVAKVNQEGNYSKKYDG